MDFNVTTVKTLNQALLKAHYNIEFGIYRIKTYATYSGRVDYIHYLADLLSTDNQQIIPTGRQIKALDIGTGANLVYPLTGSHEYNWHFTGSDIDASSIKIAKQIAQFNGLKITLKQQKNASSIFKALLIKDLFHVTLCNPPFHASADEANKGTDANGKIYVSAAKRP
ncbi:RlmF-related methyltransferase (plasmid) [Pseudoalteromonas espejiana]